MTGDVFSITARDSRTAARCGILQTEHGSVETPVFMPVGSRATVKTVAPWELKSEQVGIILSNTYHLLVRPGIDIIEELGGLHAFMRWDGPILTDSGGFQVFSLAGLRKIEAEGVVFQSHVDGSRLFMGPVEAMAAQRRLASDIAMVFDECPPFPCSRDYACQAVERTLVWASLCRKQPRAPGQLVFGIVQGGEFDDLREDCARQLTGMEFDGYAIGGVSVGEPEPVLLRGIDAGVAQLPEMQPRYLMGVGRHRQIVEAVARGVDMFDCVMPTRFARNGTAFTAAGRLAVKAGEWKNYTGPIEEGCGCPACAGGFSRAYIRHLLNVNEVLGIRLVTLHNLHHFMQFMQSLREHIRLGKFDDFRLKWADYDKEGIVK